MFGQEKKKNSKEYLAEHFTILEPRNRSIEESQVVQKHSDDSNSGIIQFLLKRAKPTFEFPDFEVLKFLKCPVRKYRMI